MGNSIQQYTVTVLENEKWRLVLQCQELDRAEKRYRDEGAKAQNTDVRLREYVGEISSILKSKLPVVQEAEALRSQEAIQEALDAMGDVGYRDLLTKNTILTRLLRKLTQGLSPGVLVQVEQILELFNGNGL